MNHYNKSRLQSQSIEGRQQTDTRSTLGSWLSAPGNTLTTSRGSHTQTHSFVPTNRADKIKHTHTKTPKYTVYRLNIYKHFTHIDTKTILIAEFSTHSQCKD